MLKRVFSTSILGNPICEKPVDNLELSDFDYYDKDGFELNKAEQKFYLANKYPIDYDCLNHRCYQEPWFELDSQGKEQGLLLDHALILHRCEYAGEAARQLTSWSKQTPKAHYLLNCRPKWGYDLALDYYDGRSLVEVIHIEVDCSEYKKFTDKLVHIEYFIKHADWISIAKSVLANKDKWQHLKGFEQNHWKANYVLGWDKAEYTEKVA